MPRLASILLLLTAVLTVVPCAGQETKGEKRKGQTPPGGVVLGPGGGYSKRVGEAHVTYVPVFGKTSASVTLADVYKQQDQSWTMAWNLTSPGKKIVRPKAVTLEIYYLRGDPVFAKVPEVNIEIDGGVVNFGALKFISNNFMRLDDRPAGAVTGEIDFQWFERIAASKRIVVRVGGIGVELNDEQSGALRDLLRTIEQ